MKRATLREYLRPFWNNMKSREVRRAIMLLLGTVWVAGAVRGDPIFQHWLEALGEHLPWNLGPYQFWLSVGVALAVLATAGLGFFVSRHESMGPRASIWERLHDFVAALWQTLRDDWKLVLSSFPGLVLGTVFAEMSRGERFLHSTPHDLRWYGILALVGLSFWVCFAVVVKGLTRTPFPAVRHIPKEQQDHAVLVLTVSTMPGLRVIPAKDSMGFTIRWQIRDVDNDRRTSSKEIA